MKTPNSHSFTPAACSLAALVIATPLTAFASDYSEAVNGELSGAGDSPTAISLSLGLNTISGKMGRGAALPGATDADIWTFNIGNGQQLSAVTFTRFSPGGSVVTGSFLAIAAGKSIAQNSAASHLSNMLVSSAGEVLGTLASQKQFSAGFGSPAGPSGVTSPLGAGDYTMWFQEAGQASVDYTITFDVQAVPEPSVFALGALGLGAVAFLRKKR